jgi:hypothetical protein
MESGCRSFTVALFPLSSNYTVQKYKYHVQLYPVDSRLLFNTLHTPQYKYSDYVLERKVAWKEERA